MPSLLGTNYEQENKHGSQVYLFIFWWLVECKWQNCITNGAICVFLMFFFAALTMLWTGNVFEEIVIQPEIIQLSRCTSPTFLIWILIWASISTTICICFQVSVYKFVCESSKLLPTKELHWEGHFATSIWWSYVEELSTSFCCRNLLPSGMWQIFIRMDKVIRVG